MLIHEKISAPDTLLKLSVASMMLSPPRAHGAEGRAPEHASREAQRAACRSAPGRRRRPGEILTRFPAPKNENFISFSVRHFFLSFTYVNIRIVLSTSNALRRSYASREIAGNCVRRVGSRGSRVKLECVNSLIPF